MYPFWELWQLYHKCVFDGENKLIIVTPSATSISVKRDIYSAWKEWAMVESNGRFAQAIRVTGGDPIGGGAYTGDVYFLVNGWRILIDHSCNIDGVIYSDDYPTPLVAASSAQIVTNKVSSLVSVVTTAGGGSGTAPTVQQIRQELDTNSTKFAQILSNIAAIPSAPSVASIVSGIDITSTKLADIHNAVNGISIPNAIQIRQEIDANSTKLNDIHNAVNGVDVPSAIEIRQEIDANSTKLATIGNQISAIPPFPTIAQIKSGVRDELTAELNHLMVLQNGQGLNSTQATMLLEIYRMYGLDPTQPLVVNMNNNTRTAGSDITQSITTNGAVTTVTREIE